MKKPFKLIASDIDGTLMLNGAQRIDESFFDCARQLMKEDVLIAPASGRQIPSLKMIFDPIKDDLVYIGDNGAVSMYKNEIIGIHPMDRKLVDAIIRKVLETPNSEIMAETADCAYICPKGETFYNRMTRKVIYKTEVVTDFSAIKDDFVKISIYDDFDAHRTADMYMDLFGKEAAGAISGAQFLDFNAIGVNKGLGMQDVREYFKLKREETAAFGDNYNDIEMLDEAGTAFVMEKAVADIQKHRDFSCSKVENTLRELFEI